MESIQQIVDRIGYHTSEQQRKVQMKLRQFSDNELKAYAPLIYRPGANARYRRCGHAAQDALDLRNEQKKTQQDWLTFLRQQFFNAPLTFLICVTAGLIVGWLLK